MSEQTQNAAPVEVAPQENQAQEETVVEGQETAPEATEALLSAKEQKQAEKLLKKYNLKVHGKDVVEEIDLNDDEAVTKHLQMSKAASQKMQEAAELRKAAEEFITLLKTNPKKVLSDPNIGVDLKKLAEDYIQEQIDLAQKSPEQLEREKLQRELAEIKEEREREKKDRDEAEQKRVFAEQEERIQSDIISALETGQLPKTNYTVRKMADLMTLALQHNVSVSAQDLIPILRNQIEGDVKDLFTSASDDVMDAILGKDILSRIRKRSIAKVQTPKVETANQVKPTGASESKKEETAKPKGISMRDFLK